MRAASVADESLCRVADSWNLCTNAGIFYRWAIGLCVIKAVAMQPFVIDRTLARWSLALVPMLQRKLHAQRRTRNGVNR